MALCAQQLHRAKLATKFHHAKMAEAISSEQSANKQECSKGKTQSTKKHALTTNLPRVLAGSSVAFKHRRAAVKLTRGSATSFASTIGVCLRPGLFLCVQQQQQRISKRHSLSTASSALIIG
jgi:hypothetical protein